MKILIIEDDPMMYRLYQRILEHEKYEVIVVDNPLEGIKKVEELQPNVVLLDIMMPKLDGIEALKKIKSNKNTKDIPVIMLTNLGTDNVVTEAFQAGASGFLVKSQTSNDELIKQIKTIVKA